MADIRCFFTPKPKTELPAEWKEWIDGLPEEGRKIVLNEYQARLNELTKPELEEAYRQGFKDALERAEEEVWADFKFEPTLQDIASGGPTMSKEVNGDMLYRNPTEAELDEVIWRGPLFRFPIAYTWDGIKYVTYRAVLTGTTWTLREFVERAQMIYSVQKGKHLKAMGDHIFFEGFVGDTFHCGS